MEKRSECGLEFLKHAHGLEHREQIDTLTRDHCVSELECREVWYGRVGEGRFQGGASCRDEESCVYSRGEGKGVCKEPRGPEFGLVRGGVRWCGFVHKPQLFSQSTVDMPMC